MTVKIAIIGLGQIGASIGLALANHKDQVTTMVTRLLRMTDPPRPADAADALALAICHLWRAPAIAARRAGHEAATATRGGGR